MAHDRLASVQDSDCDGGGGGGEEREEKSQDEEVEANVEDGQDEDMVRELQLVNAMLLAEKRALLVAGM